MTTPEKVYEEAFRKLQERLSKLLTPEVRLELGTLLRDFSEVVRPLDPKVARGVVFVGSLFEHSVRSDDPPIPEEPKPMWTDLTPGGWQTSGRPKTRFKEGDLVIRERLRSQRSNPKR